MKFSEMPYTRPDPETVKKELQDLTGRLKNAQSYQEAREVFLEKEEKAKHVETMGTLAYVRHAIDTRDEFYDGESTFWDSFGPEVQRVFLANPVYLIIKYFRVIVIDASLLSWHYHLLMAAEALIVLALGCWMYKKYNHQFLYYV